MNLGAIRQYFANVIRESGLIPDSARISIRVGPGLGETASFRCQWPLTGDGTGAAVCTREITVKMTTTALKAFRAATPQAREDMSARFIAIFNTQFRDWQHNGQDSSPAAFVIHIDEHCLDA